MLQYSILQHIKKIGNFHSSSWHILQNVSKCVFMKIPSISMVSKFPKNIYIISRSLFLYTYKAHKDELVIIRKVFEEAFDIVHVHFAETRCLI